MARTISHVLLIIIADVLALVKTKNPHPMSLTSYHSETILTIGPKNREYYTHENFNLKRNIPFHARKAAAG